MSKTLTSSLLLKSAYEIQREENIRNNEAILRELGLLGPIAESSVPAEEKKSKAPRVKKEGSTAAAARKRKREPAVPTRRSSRVLGKAAELSTQQADNTLGM